jgi:hypothetical protein
MEKLGSRGAMSARGGGDDRSLSSGGNGGGELGLPVRGGASDEAAVRPRDAQGADVESGADAR